VDRAARRPDGKPDDEAAWSPSDMLPVAAGRGTTGRPGRLGGGEVTVHLEDDEGVRVDDHASIVAA
jgi:hypothetical protein